MPPYAPSSAPPHGAASTLIRPSAPPYRASPSSLRVEQLPNWRYARVIAPAKPSLEQVFASWASLGAQATEEEIATALATLVDVLDQELSAMTAGFIVEKVHGAEMPAAAVWRLAE